MDDRNDFNFNINLPIDNVSNFTMQQTFYALQPDVRSIPAFRNRLMQQTANNQQVEVNNLFNRYGY